MARLLHAPGEERRHARKRLAEIYGLRSKVVHGVEVSDTVVQEAAREAMRATVQVLRILVRERPDLVPMTSAERSTQILME